MGANECIDQPCVLIKRDHELAISTQQIGRLAHARRKRLHFKLLSIWHGKDVANDTAVFCGRVCFCSCCGLVGWRASFRSFRSVKKNTACTYITCT